MGKSSQIETKQYLSITEAAAFLGVSRPTIYARLQSGELPYNQISTRTIRIPASALRDFQATTEPKQNHQKLSAHDLRDYMTREEVLTKYSLSKSQFHREIQNRGIKAVRYGQKALYLKSQMKEIFFKQTYPDIKDWYTSEELAAREGITRKHICATAHKLGIAVKRAGSVCYIAKVAWDDRKLAPAIIERDYMTADQAKKHYHLGGKTFYDKINASDITKVKRGNFVYFPIRDLDRLFKDKTPKIPAEIRKNYIRGIDALKHYHIGQQRFSDETRAAEVTKVRTEGNYVWYKKEELDRLFKNIDIK